MRKGDLVLFLCCFLALGFSPQEVKFEKEGTPFKDILALAAKTGKPIMIDFYADWCSWCRKLDEDTYSDPEVGKASAQLINIKMDTATKEGGELARRYRVRGLPTIIFLYSSGEEMGRVIGYRPPEVFLEILKRVIQLEKSKRDQATGG